MLLTKWLISDILIIIISVIIGLYIYFKFYIFNFWRAKGVLYKEPTFPTGNMMPVLTGRISNAKYFKDLYEQYKRHKFFGIYMLHKPFLVVNDPNLIREILTREFASFHDRGIFCNEETDPLSGHLFQLPGKKWRNLRIKLTPTFTSGKLKQMFPVMKESGDHLAKILNEKARIGSTVDVKDMLAKYSLDIIMSVAFGITCDSFNNPKNIFHQMGKKAFAPNAFWNTLCICAPEVFEIFSMPYNERAFTKNFNKLFKETVEHRISNNIVRKDFLNLLIQLIENGYVAADDASSDNTNISKTEGNKLTMTEAAAQAYVFYLAGYETSSTTATFCLYELAKNQDVQNKLREEIRKVIKEHGGLTYAALHDMNYLQKVISETLRKYPPVIILNRICTKEVQLKETDLHIPVGTPIIIPIIGLHGDAEIYPEPEKFDPERFSEENVKTRHSYAYLPFGEGPRICIGLRFGMTQTKVAIVSVISKNIMKLAPGTPTTLDFEEGSLILMPKGGVHLTIAPVQ
ncbi:Probable cytochrome P450 6a20 [Anthophora plagiata]